MKKPPKFSIIVPHYQWDGSAGIRHTTFMRGMNSIVAQTFTDFEVLVYHDGPPSEPELLKESPFPVIVTKTRHNDFGHSLRDMGIKKATGEYIIHTNPDNVFYSHALEKLDEASSDTRFNHFIKTYYKYHINLEAIERSAKNLNNILVYPIYLMGTKCFGVHIIRMRTKYDKRDDDGTSVWDEQFKHLCTGNPPVANNIDAMQLVMKRSMWLEHGGWYDRKENGDSVMYEKFITANQGAQYLTEVLGEHY